jgi:myo-inositol 2-dehydrogenase/D-chiro-inositol 1-dehydrogenase/scyllo-inositol 2-dehydrogenase (NAD+)
MVGAGRVGQLHTASIMNQLRHRAEVAAVVDADLASAANLAAEFDVPAVHQSLAEALASGSFDGAVITTPTFTHCELTLAALDAGLPVHLEKPMAMNLVECAAINDAIARTGLLVQLGFMRRFDRDFQAAAELLESGEIGVPMIIKSLTHGPGLPPAWANDIATSNGLIAEVCSHDLDTIGWFAAAQPVDIGVKAANFKGAERGVTAPRFYDTMVATVTFESGAIASVAGVCPADYGYDSRVEVTATKGMVQVGETGPGGLAVVRAGNGVKEQALYPSWRKRFAEAYIAEMAGFLDVLEGTAPKVGPAEGTQAVALAVAGVASLLSGRTVALSQVLDNPQIPSWQRDGR